MAITSERLRQTFSEGGAQEIYHEVRAEGDFLGFARQYVFDPDYRVARSALWGLTKATDEELSELQVILDELIEQAIHTENSSTRRLTLNIIERLKMNEEDLRTDFLDFCLEHMVSIEECQHRGVPWRPDTLHEARLSYVQLLSGTDGRTEAHPRNDGDRVLQACRKRIAPKNSQREI